MTAQFQFGPEMISFTVAAPAPERATITRASCPKSKPLRFTLKLERTEGDLAIYRVASAEPVQ